MEISPSPNLEASLANVEYCDIKKLYIQFRPFPLALALLRYREIFNKAAREQVEMPLDPETLLMPL